MKKISFELILFIFVILLFLSIPIAIYIDYTTTKEDTYVMCSIPFDVFYSNNNNTFNVTIENGTCQFNTIIKRGNNDE